VDANGDTWPSFVPGALNGLPVVRFDGNDRIDWNDVDALTNETEYTMFMVVSTVLNGGTFLSGSDNGANQVEVATGDGTIEFVHDPGTPSSVSSSHGWSHVDAHIVTVRRTTNRMSVWVDGRHRFDADAADAAALGADLTFTAGSGPTGHLHGDIGE